MAQPQPQLRSDLIYSQVYSPNYLEKYAFHGYAKAISSFNVEGPFDILPKHENFMTLIFQKVIVTDVNGKKHEYAVNRGFLEAASNEVKIFLEF